jgi:hypothetical protein
MASETSDSHDSSMRRKSLCDTGATLFCVPVPWHRVGIEITYKTKLDIRHLPTIEPWNLRVVQA